MIKIVKKRVRKINNFVVNIFVIVMPATLEFLPAKTSQKLGIIGFCYGGYRVSEVLSRDRDDSFFDARVSFYGTAMDKSAAAGVKLPIMFIAGDEDPLCPVNTLSEVAEIVNNESKVVVFEGEGTGLRTGRNLLKRIVMQRQLSRA